MATRGDQRPRGAASCNPLRFRTISLPVSGNHRGLRTISLPASGSHRGFRTISLPAKSNHQGVRTISLPHQFRQGGLWVHKRPRSMNLCKKTVKVKVVRTLCTRFRARSAFVKRVSKRTLMSRDCMQRITFSVHMCTFRCGSKEGFESITNSSE